MSENQPPLSRADVEQLREKLSAAEAAIPDVTYANGYPIYPKAFQDFTGYISRSPWHRTDYTNHMRERLDERIETLTLGEVRSYLTFLTRVDRFSPGGLLGKLEEGLARKVVERAEDVLKQK
ncbi:MAG: DUF6508 domain-containing protein [Verrucomicrobiales bacterium]|nr:DUF6508 domain-containing protein [Verrucomicrobiales bacterium]